LQSTKKSYLKKVKISSSQSIVIFASGNGSNAHNIILYFKNHPSIKVSAVFCNKPNAKVVERAKDEGVEVFIFTKAQLTDSNLVLNQLKIFKTDYIILAGFLLKIPEKIIKSFPDKIINIHPALLPKFGGKGMYGMHVHRAVVEHQEPESGITIHYVNEHYDEGAIIFQAKCQVQKTDTAEDVASKIHDLEMQHFPEVIHGVLQKARR
jgi:phosphoribosylglycinamide formyltransferase-1